MWNYFHAILRFGCESAPNERLFVQCPQTYCCDGLLAREVIGIFWFWDVYGSARCAFVLSECVCLGRAHLSTFVTIKDANKSTQLSTICMFFWDRRKVLRRRARENHNANDFCAPDGSVERITLGKCSSQSRHWVATHFRALVRRFLLVVAWLVVHFVDCEAVRFGNAVEAFYSCPVGKKRRSFVLRHAGKRARAGLRLKKWYYFHKRVF